MTLTRLSIQLIYKLLIAFFILQSPAAIAGAYDELLTAVRLNDIPAAEALFAKGMDVNTTDPGANTLLMIAIQGEYGDMVKLLLRNKARVDSRNQYGETALMLAAAAGSLEHVRLLVESGAKVNLSGWNPLTYAAWRGRTEVARYLLAKGADIDAVSLNGISALMMAARGGHFDTVKLLLWEVANPNIKSDAGATAMAWALKAGNTEIVKLLKQAGAEE